jgi:CO/xanthine dehydrogenase FAD-binding subunit
MYLRPTTLDETVEALHLHGGRVLSGGTDVFPSLGEAPLSGTVVDISGVRELSGIAVSEDGVRIGARTTWSAIARAALPPAFDALGAAAREVGAVQIQNAGTVGGNLCTASPAADGVPPLLILDASVELASRAGRRVLPLAEFITGYRRTGLAPGEVVSAVLVPPQPDAASRFLKLGARRYLVISIAMVAALVAVEDGAVAEARVAVGACSPAARRLAELEAALVGLPARAGLGAAVAPAHLAALDPIDDLRATASYRRDAALALVRRALDACVQEPPEAA